MLESRTPRGGDPSRDGVAVVTVREVCLWIVTAHLEPFSHKERLRSHLGSFIFVLSGFRVSWRLDYHLHVRDRPPTMEKQ